MTEPKNFVDISVLHDLFYYNSENGEIRWKKDSSKTHKNAGKIVGSLHKGGYLRMQIGRVSFFAHRVAWAMHYGSWPNGIVDHKNRIPNDNRIENLRIASRAENYVNSGMRDSNTSGYKGVHLIPSGRWRARLILDGKSIHLGVFDRKEDAAAAYLEKSKEVFADFVPENECLKKVKP